MVLMEGYIDRFLVGVEFVLGSKDLLLFVFCQVFEGGNHIL